MEINKRLAIKYARRLLPHFHLENYPAVFKDAEKQGFEKELLFILDEQNSAYTREYDAHTIRFLFSDDLCLYQDLDSGLELDITSDVVSFLGKIKSLDIMKEKHLRKLGL